jgi:hypothetical protein
VTRQEKRDVLMRAAEAGLFRPAWDTLPGDRGIAAREAAAEISGALLGEPFEPEDFSVTGENQVVDPNAFWRAVGNEAARLT